MRYCLACTEQGDAYELRDPRHAEIAQALQGKATAADIADKLIADGVTPAISVAILEKGTRRDSRTLVTTLAGLGEMVAREKVQSPSLIVVGEVARHAEAQALWSLAAHHQVENIA